jgi:acetyl-CoA synthetase
VYWVTDMGWMMGPWLLFGTLLLGATAVLYDGAVDHPHPGRLWELTARHGVSLLGVSPTLVRAMMRHTPTTLPPMPMLTRFGSTGEPWNPGPWRWLFETVGGSTRPIINYSGGTEISGGIVCGSMCSPLKPCAFAGPMPGMQAEVWDESGTPVVRRVGELVIKAPWIGMTRGFWNDNQRYLDTYFSRWDHVWVHGDFATVDEDGHWWIVGRSDDTLKIAGKRLGPAEVESLLVGQHGVVEAVAIGVPDDLKGEALVCFCVLRAGTEPSESRRDALMSELVRELGKPLAPKELRFIPELPRTRNGKIMRRLVRAAYLGKDTGDTSALENPGSLAHLRPDSP